MSKNLFSLFRLSKDLEEVGRQAGVTTVFTIWNALAQTEVKSQGIYRVPGFLSIHPNWLPPLPHPQASVAPPPLVLKWWAHSLAREGWGGANSDEETDTLVL
jgi:hypothetical protein